MPDIVEIKNSGNTLDVLMDGELFAVYNFTSEPQGNWHPFFHPIFGPAGVPVSQNGEFPGTLRGHYWHQGLFIAHQKFTGGNTWEQTLGKHGRIVHHGFNSLPLGPIPVGPLPPPRSSGGFIEFLEWRDSAGSKILLRETRRISIPYRPRERRVLDFELILTPGGEEPVTLEATPYHLLAFRAADSMLPLARKQEMVRRSGSLVNVSPSDAGGRVTNSEGQVDQAALGAHARWIDLSGPCGGKVAGVSIFNHPRNFRHPTAFTNFNDQTIAAAPTYHEPHRIPAGGELRLVYRVLVHAGDVVAGRVAEEYAEFERQA